MTENHRRHCREAGRCPCAQFCRGREEGHNTPHRLPQPLPLPPHTTQLLPTKGGDPLPPPWSRSAAATDGGDVVTALRLALHLAWGATQWYDPFFLEYARDHYKRRRETPKTSTWFTIYYLRPKIFIIKMDKKRCISLLFIWMTNIFGQGNTTSVRKYLSSKWTKRDVSRTKIHLDTSPFIHLDDRYFRTGEYEICSLLHRYIILDYSRPVHPVHNSSNPLFSFLNMPALAQSFPSSRSRSSLTEIVAAH